tara:strand:- start:114 stop:389 length:276 start_codon:yes stop_codon:yes gene_type:complete
MPMASKASLSDWIIVALCLLFFYWVASTFFNVNSIWGLLIFFIGFAVYFTPSLVAYRNRKKQATAIYVLNFFLGWTFIGWVVALVWGCMKD